ncbi:MAG: hypothetical protein ABI221_03615 [Candidatus Saccharimonadales bacterium]
MDYTKYKNLEFRRKYFAFVPQITITDPSTKTVVGFIKMKMWSIKGDIRVYTDKTMQQEIVRIGGRQMVSLKKIYNIFDSTTGAELISIRQNSLKSLFVRNHMDIVSGDNRPYGYIQETSSSLALFRRWIEVIPYLGALIGLFLAFVPQTFEIMYDPQGSSPQLVGRIVHKKNPVVVKMSLDTTMAQVALDPRVCVSAVSLLSILDASKNK